MNPEQEADPLFSDYEIQLLRQFAARRGVSVERAAGMAAAESVARRRPGRRLVGFLAGLFAAFRGPSKVQAVESR